MCVVHNDAGSGKRGLKRCPLLAAFYYTIFTVKKAAVGLGKLASIEYCTSSHAGSGSSEARTPRATHDQARLRVYVSRRYTQVLSYNSNHSTAGQHRVLHQLARWQWQQRGANTTSHSRPGKTPRKRLQQAIHAGSRTTAIIARVFFKLLLADVRSRVGMKGRGETEDTSDIFRHDSHMRKYERDPAENRTRFAEVGAVSLIPMYAEGLTFYRVVSRNHSVTYSIGRMLRGKATFGRHCTLRISVISPGARVSGCGNVSAEVQLASEVVVMSQLKYNSRQWLW
ncbi:hypothetical protein PR048_000047 [Dryococelus australis]|uniref:Uncharacterized protein n=1 Tax=Dryococelus australis TaxID=614101 RepID=A0ABQ9IDJ0_9NEOP|nr:hypothetical protein PR048_000047 [Dryococelus australis]